MRVILRWSPRSQRRRSLPATSTLAPEQRLDLLLKAAHLTPAFSASHRPFDSLPPVPLDEYWARPHSFQNPSPPPRLARVQYPLEPQPRLAVIAPGFVENQHTLCFPHGWCQGLRDFQAEALAGPVSALRRLAKSVFNRGAHFGHLKRPLLVFTGFGFTGVETLSDEDRDLFWKAFHLPIYEQFLGLGQELLAAECDAHRGLHLLLDRTLIHRSIDGELLVTSLANLSTPIPKIATGLHATLDFEPCPCGHPGPRLMSLAPLPATATLRSSSSFAMASD